jgi:talin
VNENLNFDEQILEAAKSIMNAASALITAATSAQKELVAQGKVSLKKQKYLNRIDILIDNKCD